MNESRACVTSGMNINESRQSHVGSKCVTSHMNEACHIRMWPVNIRMRHVEYEWVTYPWLVACHIYEWVTSHIWMSHATHMNESCHTYEWVMSHIWMSHVTHMNESRHTYEWVTSHIWMRHVTHMNEACHTYEWVTWHILDQRCQSEGTSLLCLKMSHMKKSRPAVKESHISNGWAMSLRNESCPIWRSHVPQRRSHVPYDGSCHTYPITDANRSLWRNHRWNESCPIWMSHVPYGWVMCHINESCHTWMSHVTGSNRSLRCHHRRH